MKKGQGVVQRIDVVTQKIDCLKYLYSKYILLQKTENGK